MYRAGNNIGPYTLIKKLGRGSFGVVWLAERRTAITTTKVALKLPLDEDIDLNSIKHEANLWVQASGHPNILPIIEANIYEEQIVIVSEYSADGSLEDWLVQNGGRAPSIEVAVDLVLGILSGLEHLHSRKIIHRDIKPANILLQGNIARLADFGIARIIKTNSQATVAAGTPTYMAPEAFDAIRSERTDIWAVGVIFYQLLTGILPFPQPDMASLMRAIMMGEAPPLPSSIPQNLQQIIARVLQKDPAQRYSSATEMRMALRQHAHHQVLPPGPLLKPTQIAMETPKQLHKETYKQTSQDTPKQLADWPTKPSLQPSYPIESNSKLMTNYFRLKLTSIVQMVCILLSIVAIIFNVETILAIGPLISIVGFVICWHGFRARMVSGVIFGFSALFVSLLSFFVIFINRWGPSNAREPMIGISIGYFLMCFPMLCSIFFDRRLRKRSRANSFSSGIHILLMIASIIQWLMTGTIFIAGLILPADIWNHAITLGAMFFNVSIIGLIVAIIGYKCDILSGLVTGITGPFICLFCLVLPIALNLGRSGTKDFVTATAFIYGFLMLFGMLKIFLTGRNKQLEISQQQPVPSTSL